MAKSEEELKSLLMRLKEESKKAGLKLNIQKTKIMSSGPITSWQIETEKVGALTGFIFLPSKITVDINCSHGIKWCLPLEWKLWQSSQHIKKAESSFWWHISYGQSYSFSSSHVQIWQLYWKEGLDMKILCFWIVVLKKTLDNLLESKEIKPANPKGNQPWIFIGRTVLKGSSEGKRRGWQWMRLLDSITNSMDTNLNNLQEIVEDRGAWHATVHEVSNRHYFTQQYKNHMLLV